MRIVNIDYNPETQVNNEKHTVWERVITFYHLLSIGSDEGDCRLICPDNLSLEQLARDLRPIKILSSA